MSEEQTPQDVPETAEGPVVVPEATADPVSPPVVEPPAAAPPVVEPDPVSTPDDDPTPDPRITKANEEAKRYRLQLREAESNLDALKGQLESLDQKLAQQFEQRINQLESDVTAAQSAAATAELEALRFRLAAEAGLPAEMTEFLTGDDADSIKAQAAKLKSLIPNPGIPMVGNADEPKTSHGQKLFELSRGNQKNSWSPDIHSHGGGGVIRESED